MSGTGHGEHPHPAPGVATHGMLVFGEEPIYVSHLPMFHPPHNFQVLAEVGFASREEELYRSDRAETGEKVYTIAPERFALEELVSPPLEAPARTSFRATLFRGHFERGGEAIIQKLLVNVERVAHFQELPVERADERALTYRCFGGAGGFFLVHEVHAPPDFDQVLRFRFAEQEFEELTFSGAPVKIRDHVDELDQRLTVGDEATAFFFQSIGPGGQHGFSTGVVVEDEVYLESGELAG